MKLGPYESAPSWIHCPGSKGNTTWLIPDAKCKTKNTGFVA